MFFLGISYFLKTLGPAIGYALASVCLKVYISPTLTPTINNKDPRWLGAWWLGWIILGCIIFVFASLLALFPKQLPRAAARKIQKQIFHASSLKQETKSQILILLCLLSFFWIHCGHQRLYLSFVYVDYYCFLFPD